jgi:ABC-type polysaccharide/polyol phosphate export permease
MALWSIIGNASLVTKVYFAGLLLVLSSNLADFICSSLEFLALFPLLIVLGVRISWLVLLIPVTLATEFVLVAARQNR